MISEAPIPARRQVIGSVAIDWIDWMANPAAVEKTMNDAGFPLKLGAFLVWEWENKEERIERFMRACKEIKASGFTIHDDLKKRHYVFEWWQWVAEPQADKVLRASEALP